MKFKLVFHVGYRIKDTISVQSKFAELLNIQFLGKSIFERKRKFRVKSIQLSFTNSAKLLNFISCTCGKIILEYKTAEVTWVSFL